MSRITACVRDQDILETVRQAPSDIVQVVVKDGDDARNLTSVVLAQFLVVGLI
jgi:hypothetical protein